MRLAFPQSIFRIGGRLALTLTLALASVACTTVSAFGPGGASPGTVFTRVTYPNRLSPNDAPLIELDADDIEIVGPVEGADGSFDFTVRFFFQYVSPTVIVTGGGQGIVVASGDSGYASAFQNLARRNEVDGILNKYVDTQYYNLDLVLLRGDAVRTRIGGIGYRLKNPAAVASAAAAVRDSANKP